MAIRLSLAEWLEARDEMFLLALQQLYIILSKAKLEVYSYLSGKYTCKWLQKWQIQLNLQQQMSVEKGLESDNMTMAKDTGLDVVA